MEGPGREMASGPSAATRNEILTVTTRPFAAAANRTLSKFKPLNPLASLEGEQQLQSVDHNLGSLSESTDPSGLLRAVGFEVTG